MLAGDEPGRRPAASPPSSAASTSSRATSRPRLSASSSRSRSPRHCSAARGAVAGAEHEGSLLLERRPTRVARAARAWRSQWRSSTTSRCSRCARTTTSAYLARAAGSTRRMPSMLPTQGLALARTAWRPGWEWALLGDLSGLQLPHRRLGRRRCRSRRARPEARELRRRRISRLDALVEIHVERGELDAAGSFRPARRTLDGLGGPPGSRTAPRLDDVVLAPRRGSHEQALAAATRAVAARDDAPASAPRPSRCARAKRRRSRLCARRPDAGRAVAARPSSTALPPGRRSVRVDGHICQRRRAPRRPRGRSRASRRWLRDRRSRSFREVQMPFWLAVTLLEYGEWLAGDRRRDEAEPLLAEAREIFERLRAAPWLERVDAASSRSRGDCSMICPTLWHREPRRAGSSAPSAARSSSLGVPVCGAAKRRARSSAASAVRPLQVAGCASRSSDDARPPSAGSSPSSSPTSSASRRSPRAATPRTCASSSRATSTRPGV